MLPILVSTHPVLLKCKSREEMSMQGIREEEVVLASALIEVGIADVGVE
jgi:hypothetical protein